MKVINVHQRLLHASPARIDELLQTLGSPHDQVWPRDRWPRMVLDGPLGVGASGGHGPVRYFVEAREPGFVAFRFRMRGVEGWHGFEVLEATQQHRVLEHRMEAELTGGAAVRWAAVMRHLHDACVEDMLSNVQRALGDTPNPVAWSPYVKWLRRMMLEARPRMCRRRANHAA
jgi:hypothetical protein